MDIGQNHKVLEGFCGPGRAIRTQGEEGDVRMERGELKSCDRGPWAKV